MNGSAPIGNRTVNVLHVENSETFRDLVADLLTTETDICVVSVASPVEALQRLSDERFDCVISDYDGNEEAAYLPVIEATIDGPPCILLTGKDRESVDPAATVGIDEYVRKGAGNDRFDRLAERVRSHAERYWTSERYRALFEEGTGPIVVHDADSGAIIDMNPQVLDLLGYDRGEPNDLRLSDLIPDEEPYTTERAEALVERAGGGESITEDWECVTLDGERIPVEVTLKRIDVAGEGRIVVAIRDISERKRRGAALERHQRNLERLHHAAERLLAAETHEEVYEEVANAADSVLSPSKSLVMIREYGMLHPVVMAGRDAPATLPEPSPMTEGPAARALKSGDTQVDETTDESRLCVPIGNHGVLCFSGYEPEQENAQELTEVLTSQAAVALDRADREAELQADHERMGSLAAAFPDYAFFYDADGEYQEVWLASGREAEMNITEELVGRSVQDVLDDDPAATVQAAIDAAVDTGEVQDVEYAISGQAGTFWYEGRVAPLPDTVAGETEVVLVARNVTTQHEYEQQLERQNERLDEFASLVSHDLRNPLNVVQGRLTLVESAVDDESVLEHVTAAESAAVRMNDLIEDMLTVARTNELELSISTVDLEDAVERAWASVSEPEAVLTVTASLSLRADKAELIRLLENLFRNSVEHAGPDVSIRVEPLSDGFAVVDDGSGIAADKRDAVFESGFSTATDGTGFGLGIVNRVAEAHGWEVSLADTTVGTRFDVTGVTLVETDESGADHEAV